MREEHRKRRVYNWPRATIHHGSPKFHKVPRRIESDHRSKEQSRSGIEDPAFWHQPPRTQTHNPSTQLPLRGSDTTLASLIISSTFDLLLLLATGVCVCVAFLCFWFVFLFLYWCCKLLNSPARSKEAEAAIPEKAKARGAHDSVWYAPNGQSADTTLPKAYTWGLNNVCYLNKTMLRTRTKVISFKTPGMQAQSIQALHDLLCS
jgi:hypothetical protein